MKDYLELWTEDEKALWMDTGFTTSVGFITTDENGWGITKNWLATMYQWQLIHQLEKLRTSLFSRDKLQAIQHKVEKRVLKRLKKAIKGFKLLEGADCRSPEDKLWDDLTIEYFVYCLKGELFDMIYRIEAVIDDHYESRDKQKLSGSPKEWWSSLINTLANLEAPRPVAYVD